jgi:predicted ATPase
VIRKQIYIITGGPGFGKTELINELRQSEFRCSDEFARKIIEENIISGGEILPWKNTGLFQLEVLKQRIEFFESVPENTIAFADRGIVDQLAFARHKGFGSPKNLMQNASKYRYAEVVFVTPPWKEIFINDMIRTESFDEAVKIHRQIIETYQDLNYTIIELPLVPIKMRVEFILLILSKFGSDEY